MPAKVDPGRQLNICLHLPEVSGVQLPSTHAPADDRRFDWAVGIHTLPRAATPSAQEWNDIGADVIFAKKFKRLVRRRKPLVSKGVDSVLPCRHAVSIIPVVMNADTILPACLYSADRCVIKQRGPNGI